MKKFLMWCGFVLLICSVIACGSSGGGGVSSQTRAVTGFAANSKCSVPLHLEGYYYIVEMFDITGALSTATPIVENALLMAVDEINTGGGIHGKKLGIIRCNAQGSPSVGTSIINELMGISPYSLIFGPQTSPEFLGSKAANVAAQYPTVVAAGKTMMITTIPSPILSQIPNSTYPDSFNGYVFRTAMSNEYMGKIVANMASDHPFVIYSAPSQSLRTTFGKPMIHYIILLTATTRI